MDNIKSRFLRLLPSLRWFSGAATAWLAVTCLLTIGEWVFLRSANGDAADLGRRLPAMLLDAVAGCLRLCPWLLLIFLLASAVSGRMSRIVMKIAVLLLIILRLVLADYFSRALVPLGADLYGYSLTDIRQTAGSAGGASGGFVLVAVFASALTWWSLGWAGSKWSASAFVAPAFTVVGPALAAVGILLLCTGWKGIPTGGTEFTRNATMDKTGFFLDESWDHFTQTENTPDIYADAYLTGEPAAEGWTTRSYVGGADYPMLYKSNAPDVLSPYFHKDVQRPNIVVILVEGLGRAFTNEGAYLGNFTPFIDSLAKESLYWDNFLSEGGRTFAVLPSILGSLPFARNGFLELGAGMPPSFSLVNILKANGYQTSFYYGGDASFDNMSLYLERMGIGELKDGASFPAGYTKIPSTGGFTWGYNDDELFRWWQHSRPVSATSPQLSIILTVSTHSPFLLNDPGEYTRLLEERMTQLGMDENEKAEHRRYRQQYASILYTDQALRGFFSAFGKRPDFAHTIFVITGDHRMPEIPMRDKIDRFHVPLLVYSPLLQRKSLFSSVSTHFDIAPSLLAFLHGSYDIQIPGLVTWMGDGLDTCRSFRNIHSYPLMQTKTDLVDYIQGDIHLNGDRAFRLRPQLDEIPLDDDSGHVLQAAMALYKDRNDRWLKNGRLIPDSLVRGAVH